MLLLAGLSPVGAEQPYWICVDAGGIRTVQDVACADAPDAPASGHTAGRRSPNAGVAPRAVEMDSGAWWLERVSGAAVRVSNPEEWRRVIRNPWTHAVVGVLVLILIVVWMARKLLAALHRRRLQSDGLAQPDFYRHALQNITVEPSASVPRAALRTKGVAPTQWTPEVLRLLGPVAFGELALSLWRARGIGAELDVADAQVILLRKPAKPDELHGIAFCRTSAEELKGAGAVRELFGLMQHHGCTYGALMTPGEFDMDAREFVRGKAMELKGATTLMIEIEALPEADRATLLDRVLHSNHSVVGSAPSTSMTSRR